LLTAQAVVEKKLVETASLRISTFFTLTTRWIFFLLPPQQG